MNTWKDKSWSDGKILNLISILTIVIFLFSTYISLKIFINSKDLYKALNISLPLIFCSIISMLLILTLIFRLKTVKFAILYTDRISGECHYSVKFNIDFKEIKAINEYKNNLLFKAAGLFSKETPGFEIELKSGKKYYVSPHLNDIASLRNTLLAGMTEQS